MVGADGRGIFPVDGILDPVETVLDLPVSPDEREDPLGGAFFGGEAGDSEDGLGTDFPIFLETDMAIDTKDLPDEGEGEVVIEGGGGANGLGVDATVTEGDLLSLQRHRTKGYQ